MANATTNRRALLLAGLAALIGLAGGVAAYVLIHLIALLTNLAFFHRVEWTLPSFTNLPRSPNIVIVPVIRGLLAGNIGPRDPIPHPGGLPRAVVEARPQHDRRPPPPPRGQPRSARRS